MASYSISYTYNSITFKVSGLSSGDRVNLYVRYENSVDNTVVDEVYFATSSTLNRTFTIPSNSSYAANCNVNGTWLGKIEFKTESGSEPDPEPTRPGNWYWSSIIAEGGPINLSAVEWNDFCDRINKFRGYKGLSTYHFSYTSRGNKISASIVNEAVSAISPIPGHGTLPSYVSAGNPIRASFFNSLVTALNSID